MIYKAKKSLGQNFLKSNSILRKIVEAGEVKVYLDGKLIDNLNSGIDVENGIVTVDKDRLYSLVQLKNAQNHLLRLEFSPGIEAFAFTFG